MGMVGTLFIFHPKFKNHPYPFLGLTCLVESSMFFQAVYLSAICDPNYQNLINLVQTRLQFGQSSDNDIVIHNIILLGCLEVQSGLQNIQMNYDLLVSIKNPFKDRKGRTKYYYMVDILVFVFTYYV